MLNKSALPEPWLAFLSEVDAALSRNLELHCLGGFVLTAIYGVPRVTGDLDYIAVVPRDASEELANVAGRASKLAQKYRVYLQQSGAISDYPEDYEERLVDLNLGLEKLSVRALEPYDLLLSKLTRNSPKDREDVGFLAAKLRMSFGKIFERFEREMKTPGC